MKFFTQTKILSLIVIILLVSNISTIITIYYSEDKLDSIDKTNNANTSKVIDKNKGYFFRDRLNLSDKQHEAFRVLRQNYNRKARQLSYQMHDQREELIQELNRSNPDSTTLDSIAISIGSLHTDLKRFTSEYYQNMKKECNEDQAQELMKIFLQLLNNEGNVKLPESGGQGRRGNRNLNNSNN